MSIALLSICLVALFAVFKLNGLVAFVYLYIKVFFDSSRGLPSLTGICMPGLFDLQVHQLNGLNSLTGMIHRTRRFIFRFKFSNWQWDGKIAQITASSAWKSPK